MTKCVESPDFPSEYYNKDNGLIKGNSPCECGYQGIVQQCLHIENTLGRKKRDFE